MPPIKGWKKEKDERVSNNWRIGRFVVWKSKKPHPDKPGKPYSFIRLEQNKPDDYPPVEVYVARANRGISKHTFENVKEARKWAVSWMRNHPNG